MCVYSTYKHKLIASIVQSLLVSNVIYVNVFQSPNRFAGISRGHEMIQVYFLDYLLGKSVGALSTGNGATAHKLLGSCRTCVIPSLSTRVWKGRGRMLMDPPPVNGTGSAPHCRRGSSDVAPTWWFLGSAPPKLVHIVGSKCEADPETMCLYPRCEPRFGAAYNKQIITQGSLKRSPFCNHLKHVVFSTPKQRETTIYKL